MSLKNTYENLLNLKRTASTNSKVSLLTEYLKNDTFKRVIQLMYDEEKYFKINSLPKYKPSAPDLFNKKGNEELFNFLETLAIQKGATNEDKNKLASLASIDKETYEVVKLIINKDAKCGFSGKLINKAHPNLITIMPYCRCSTAEKKMSNIKFEPDGAIIQEKADGMFDNVIIHNNEIILRSRNGNIIHQMDHLIAILQKMPDKYKETVYMGELLIRKNGVILPRKVGNGILNSCIQNAEIQEDAKYAILKLWDAVPYKDFIKGDCPIEYKFRLGRVSSFVKTLNSDIIHKIPSVLVYSLLEALEIYKKYRLKGKEGAIVKNQTALWKDHTSPDQVKLKNESEAELRIIGWKPGKEGTKYEHCAGAIICASEDKKLIVSVSGLTDEQRNWDWDEYVGKIVSVVFESVISDKSKSTKSLYLPRFDKDFLRPDRNTADTLDEIENR